MGGCRDTCEHRRAVTFSPQADLKGAGDLVGRMQGHRSAPWRDHVLTTDSSKECGRSPGVTRTQVSTLEDHVLTMDSSKGAGGHVRRTQGLTSAP